MRRQFRDGFTLIELLVVVAILGIMVTAGVVSLTSGQGAARVRGAARDVVASIRHARSVALVSQQPATIAFSNEAMPEGGTAAHVKINSVKIISTNAVTQAMTLDGELVNLQEEEPTDPSTRRRGKSRKGEEPVAEDSSAGEDIGDILFAPVSEDVMRGVRLKVLTGDEAEAAVGSSGVSSYSTADRSRSRVSVFSTADYINSKYQEKTAKEAEEKAKEESTETSASADTAEEGSGPVSIVWEVNGRTEPHCVWVYRDGMKPEDGLLIKVDRFGAVKVLSGDGRQDEE